MKILIANPGSTSYKCKLFDMSGEAVLFEAAVERIGDASGIYSYKFQNEEKKRRELEIPNFHFAVNLTLETLGTELSGSDLTAVGFKTVHAKGVTGCVELSDDVLQAIRDYLPLAPVHNQVYLTAISVFRDILADTPLYGLFETSFHAEIPPEAYLYGVPYEYYEKYGIRKYGFHGASHRYIGQRACELFVRDRQECRVISCHLGGSSSVCAIKNGVSLDTSMGMSPQSGLLNATRTGDLDTYALLYLMEKEGLSIEATRKMLMSRGGVYGISGSSGDMRDIESAMENGSHRDALAFRTFAYYVKRYIGEYLAVLNGADVIAFTGGAGQNSVRLRETILKEMEALGIHLDSAKNESNPEEGLISSEKSPVKIAVIPTNEELIVAREVEKSLNE